MIGRFAASRASCGWRRRAVAPRRSSLYWGVLESSVAGEVAKGISSVPLLDPSIPDQTQKMRIRLKVALIDVRTGDWSTFAPESRADSSLSAERNRANSGQDQVALLKDEASKAAAAELVARYAP